MHDLYVVKKGIYYYRPGGRGYTALPSEAAWYTLAQAQAVIQERSELSYSPLTKEILEEVIPGMVSAQVASCSCMTKTPEAGYHDPKCRYRALTAAHQVLERLIEKEYDDA